MWVEQGKISMAAKNKFLSLFGHVKVAVIGMVHVQALPGSPKHCSSVDQILQSACAEAEMYKEAGVDGVIVENMHDVPYLRGPVEPHTVSVMTRIGSEVHRLLGEIPLGVQLLSGSNKEALAVAMASGASFVRAEGFVYSHVSDEGWSDACAGELLRYRRNIGAQDIMIFTDIKKKHCSHSVTADLDIVDIAQAAEFFLSDGVIVTGKATGQEADLSEISRVRESVDLPVVVGSGISVGNIECYARELDGVIVGSQFKHGGMWYNGVDRERVLQFMDKVRDLRMKY